MSDTLKALFFLCDYWVVSIVIFLTQKETNNTLYSTCNMDSVSNKVSFVNAKISNVSCNPGVLLLLVICWFQLIVLHK
jgi:hypothetical protein